jgi:hypothetical protein
MAYLPATSAEDLYVPVSAEATGLPVQIAIVPAAAGEPADAEYHAAAWADGGEVTLLIGAGTPVPLTPGEYVVWVRITASGQAPVRRAGLLTVGTP